MNIPSVRLPGAAAWRRTAVPPLATTQPVITHRALFVRRANRAQSGAKVDPQRRSGICYGARHPAGCRMTSPVGNHRPWTCRSRRHRPDQPFAICSRRGCSQGAYIPPSTTEGRVPRRLAPLSWRPDMFESRRISWRRMAPPPLAGLCGRMVTAFINVDFLRYPTIAGVLFPNQDGRAELSVKYHLGGRVAHQLSASPYRRAPGHRHAV
jgi:hypothetical protein